MFFAPLLARAARVAAVATLAFLGAACVVRSERSDNGGGFVGPSTTGGTTSDGADAASPTPILVEIDTGKTMSANPGEGVGVFTEYTAGGHWHVWWTCDTNKTGASCTFDIRVSGTTMTNIAPEKLLAGDTAQSTPTQIDLHTETKANVAGVTFDTAPGDIVQVEAQIGGVADPSFFFFVQDGKVNGGYAGKLTNPLLFQGTSP